jgi:hypothetical protein
MTGSTASCTRMLESEEKRNGAIVAIAPAPSVAATTPQAHSRNPPTAVLFMQTIASATALGTRLPPMAKTAAPARNASIIRLRSSARPGRLARDDHW